MPMGIKLQKLIVAFVAGLIAVGSGIALTHVGRAPDRTAAEVSDATPTIGEGRNLTREILRSRREHGEAMAEVHPDPSLGERERIVTKEPARQGDHQGGHRRQGAEGSFCSQGRSKTKVDHGRCRGIAT